MKKLYALVKALIVLFAIFTLASCKKDNSSSSTPGIASPVKLGLYLVKGKGSDFPNYTYYEQDINISGIGTEVVNYQLIFDTGSGGLVMDAANIIPASMITSTGFNFTGDSTVVNGITITSQTATLQYGSSTASADKVYGNLAYAQVTIGDQNSNLVVKRLPFLLYYKAVNSSNVAYSAHYFDIFGSAEIYDQNFTNNVNLTSPFSYCSAGNGLTKGFKITALDSSQYTGSGNYVTGAISFGLTSSDLSSGGFSMNQLNFNSSVGYLPYLNSTISYNSTSFSTHVLFDSGTNYCSYLGDPNYTGTFAPLTPNTQVSLTTALGFNYTFTETASSNLSFVENPGANNASISIMGVEYFFKNEYLLDLENHRLGLKNN